MNDIAISSFVPADDRILVEPIKSSATSSGIVTVGDSGIQQGIVVEVGPGRIADDGRIIPMRIKKGVEVYFKSGYDVDVLKFGDSEYMLMRESSILGSKFLSN